MGSVTLPSFVLMKTGIGGCMFLNLVQHSMEDGVVLSVVWKYWSGLILKIDMIAACIIAVLLGLISLTVFLAMQADENDEK